MDKEPAVSLIPITDIREPMATILVLYYSRNGSTLELARHVCRGVESVAGATALLRTVPSLTTTVQPPTAAVPAEGPPYVTAEEWSTADGIALGSPTRFGNMAAPLKYFLDSTSAAWASGALVGRPAGVFTSTSTLHGGHESTLLTMMLPLLHHGMLLVGIPFTESALARSQGGGPYGAGAVVHGAHSGVGADEKQLAQTLGRRIATAALRLGGEPRV
jgi:NAD(P)H dehydrogenase (quinone)